MDMKSDTLFENTYLIPALEKHKEFVLSIYPNAYFSCGYIYNEIFARFPINNRKFWSRSGIKTEYYAWLWAAEYIQEEIMEKLSV